MNDEMNDDWMNPPTSGSWQATRHEDGIFYLISRKRRIPVSGNVSYIERWETWQEFKDKAERDAELERLRETTVWVLRADEVTYLNGCQLPGLNPRDMIDV